MLQLGSRALLRWAVIASEFLGCSSQRNAEYSSKSIPIPRGDRFGRSSRKPGRIAYKIWPAIFLIMLSAADTFAVQTTQILEVRVSHDWDDSEEGEGGAIYLTSTDLELANDDVDQTIGLRFQDVTVPPGATIKNAYIQFHANEVGTDGCALRIWGQAADDAAAFTSSVNDLSSRPMTVVSEDWVPPPWTAIGEAGPDQRTPDISRIVQEIVRRDGWSSGHSMVIGITGTGTRTADSYGGSADKAALLRIEYTAPQRVAASAFSRAAMIEQTLEVRVSHDWDDSEEDDSGTMYLTSTDLELANDGVDQIVGLRFQNVNVPPGAIIKKAYIQFQVNEASTDACALVIRGQAADDAATFTTDVNDLSSRPMTATSESWTPPPWNEIGEAGPDQRTPDISGVIQEIVSRDGWSSGHSIVIGITGTGTRTADSYGGSAESAALLLIDYGAPPWTPPSPFPARAMVEHRLEVRVSHDQDDSEEDDAGAMYLTSTDLELANDGVDQIVGLRFQDVTVPAGAVITSAYVQFQVNEVSTNACALTIWGHAADNAPAFTTDPNDLSSRPTTTLAEDWVPPPWNTVGEAGPDQRTADISGVIQEIVSRDGWTSGNSMVIGITGTGTRTANSYGGSAERAATLQIEYAAPLSTLANVLSPPSREAAPTTSMYDVIWESIRTRNLGLEFGVYYYGFNYAADGPEAIAERREGDLGSGTGYAKIRYITNPWHGFRVGGAVVGVFDFHQKNVGWEQASVDRDRYYIPKVQLFHKNAQMYEAFVNYGISRTYVKVGRQVMNSMRFGYDAAEGVSVLVNEIDKVSILFEAFWRGLEDAGYDEISRWDTVKKHGGRRGEHAEVDPIFWTKMGGS